MSRTSVLAITTAIFLGLTWITFFVRAWVRIKLVKKVGMDDKWMVAAQVQLSKPNLLHPSTIMLTVMIDSLHSLHHNDPHRNSLRLWKTHIRSLT